MARSATASPGQDAELRLIGGTALVRFRARIQCPTGHNALFGLDPAEQVFPADRGQEGRMVAGHMPPDHSDHLVIAIAAGYEPAFTPDQLRHRVSRPSL